MRGRDQFQKYKTLFKILEKIYRIFPLSYRKKAFQRKRYSKGLYGIGIRYVLLKSISEKIGDNVSIHEGCFILNPEGLQIGNNVSIHPMCYIDATGGIEIGNDVSIAHGVTIMSTSHQYEDLSVPIKDQEVLSSRTKIGNDVWIGAKSLILYGKTIGSGSIIGGGTIVTDDVVPYSIFVGNPGKILKKRKV